MKVVACFAATLDGKISTPDTDGYVQLGSSDDLDHLFCRRDESDAVLYGGATFRAFPRAHRGHDPDRLPLHVILTRSCDLDPEAPLFTQTPMPSIVIASPDPLEAGTFDRYPAEINWMSFVSARDLLDQLAAFFGVETVLLEGGGEIFWLFLREGLVDELYLTLCPRLVGGGMDTPALTGHLPLPADIQVGAELIGWQALEHELFLHYRLTYQN